MKLTSATVLEGVADALRDQIAPGLGDAFQKEAMRMALLLITIGARGSDDAAAIRVAENAAIRDLLARGAGVVTDSDLATSLRTAAASRDPGVRISELDAESGRLRVLLIDLQIALEGSGDAQARALDQAIWRALRDFEQARAPRV